MVTKTDIKAYRTAFTTDADWEASMGSMALLHMTLWSIFFTLAVIGGLMN